MAPPLQVRQRRRQLAGRPIGGLQLARRLTSTARRSDRLDPTVSPDPGPSVEMRAYGDEQGRVSLSMRDLLPSFYELAAGAAGDRKRGVAVAQAGRAREQKQACRAQAAHAWIWAIGAARDSAVGAVRRHLGTSIDAPHGLLLRSGR